MSFSKWLLIFISGLFFCPSLHSLDSLRGPLSGVTQNTLVVCDIDDTLICYGDHLGSESWFAEIYAKTSGGPEFHQLAGLLAHHLSVQPVEAELPQWVAQLQDRGVGVVGLTAREPTHLAVEDWMGKTGEQLHFAGFDLSHTAPRIDHPHYAHGVLFGGRKGKSAAFQALLEQVEPERVMIIDDRLSDLSDLSAVAEQLGVECESVWYSARVMRPYDSVAAARQLEELVATDEHR